jgi:UDP-N-acetylglucosamine 2-epimerase (non-hydrolysing)
MSSRKQKTEYQRRPLLSQQYRTDGERLRVLTLFGTRPELIKLAPVIEQLESLSKLVRTINVSSSQHTDLLYPLIKLFGVRVDHDLQVMTSNQTPNQVCSKVLTSLDLIIAQEQPHLIIVQGDTTTAMAGALAGFHNRIPVAHVEAGLRSGFIHSPFPEEMNRRVISTLATYHFAATSQNRETLINEGVPEYKVYVTGNPVVDSLKSIMKRRKGSPKVEQLLDQIGERKLIVLTSHRRENLGETILENFKEIRRFVESKEDTELVFPVHPNPNVREAARAALSDHPRVHLIEPLSYEDFVLLLSRSWLIVSDSGGLQEEAPTLCKPLLVLRENTERQEAIECGAAKLVGGSPERLRQMLEEFYLDSSWSRQLETQQNPFGNGDSGKQIAHLILELMRANQPQSLVVN